jgi:5'(3')-deoxyribonucleotidase
MKIILDMDEVLVDFVGGMARHHGTTRQKLRQKQKPGVWEMHRTLGISANTMWRPIYKSGLAFWLTLEPLPWIDDLIEMVETFDVEWHIVSSPSLAADSYFGKTCWLKNYFGHDFDRFAITPHKHLFAKPGTILIDDKDENVEAFREAGGRGIVFPTKGNSEHAVVDPLGYVYGALTAIRNKELEDARQLSECK